MQTMATRGTDRKGKDKKESGSLGRDRRESVSWLSPKTILDTNAMRMWPYIVSYMQQRVECTANIHAETAHRYLSLSCPMYLKQLHGCDPTWQTYGEDAAADVQHWPELGELYNVSASYGNEFCPTLKHSHEACRITRLKTSVAAFMSYRRRWTLTTIQSMASEGRQKIFL